MKQQSETPELHRFDCLLIQSRFLETRSTTQWLKKVGVQTND
jgi:hypothetical protein